MDIKNKEGAITNKKFQEIINLLDIGYFKGELQGKLLIHNTAVNKIIGIDPSIDLTGSKALQFFSDLEVQKSYYNELTKNGYVKDFIVEITNPKGELLYIQLNSHLVKEGEQENIYVEGTARNVTEKYNLEQKLKNSEEKYRNLFESSPNALLLIDLKGNILDCNLNSEKQSGFKRSELIGQNFKDISFIPKKYIPKVLEDLKVLLKENFLEPQEIQIYRKDGSLAWVHYQASLVKIGDQNKIQLIIQDISEIKYSEERLKDSEERYKLIMENANDLIAVLDTNLKYKYVNMGYELLGYSKEEIYNSKATDLLHPGDIKRAIKAFRSGLKTGTGSEELRIKHKDGQYYWFEVKGKTFMDIKGDLNALLISRDVTDRKKNEQKLQESERKYRTLFESSTDGIYSTDMEGKFIEFNKAFLDMLGYSTEELLGMDNRQITPPKWHEIEDNMVFNHLAVGESKIYEKEYVRKDGNTIPVSIRFWILLDEQSDPNRIWAIVRDITARKQMELELKEINRLKSEFLRRASHELKTPLISIKGFSDLILSMYSEELNPDIISKLEEINRGCERLQNIINNLLHTSRLESPELKPKLGIEDLSFLIKYCVKELHPLSAKREQSINTEIPDSIITRFEKEEIHDVISNLLINAIKYTPPGKGWIDIRTEVLEDFVVVSIKDNGIGFTEAEKNKIFQQFGKIERYGQGLDLGIDGTGLGLYISKKIVEAHGGKIWMESEGKNKGSTFYFSLPLIKD